MTLNEWQSTKETITTPRMWVDIHCVSSFPMDIYIHAGTLLQLYYIINGLSPPFVSDIAYHKYSIGLHRIQWWLSSLLYNLESWMDLDFPIISIRTWGRLRACVRLQAQGYASISISHWLANNLLASHKTSRNSVTEKMHPLTLCIGWWAGR